MDNDRFRKDYQDMMKRSMSGSFSERQRDRARRRRERMRKEEKMGRIKKMVGVVLAVSIAAASPSLVNALSDSLVMDSMIFDFKTEVIAPETHRTDDNQHYFYDYDDIAKKLNEMEDFDEGVYLLNSNVGDSQTDKVLECTQYHSFSEYKEQKGYESTDQFLKETRARILDKIKKNDNELSTMMDEENENTSSIDTIARTGEK